MKKYYSIRKLSDMIDVSAQTLRNWEKSGKLIPDYKTSSGYRYYSQEQVDTITGNKTNFQPSAASLISFFAFSVREFILYERFRGKTPKSKFNFNFPPVTSS